MTADRPGQDHSPRWSTAFAIQRVGADAAATLAEIGAGTFMQTYAALLPKEAMRAHCALYHSTEAWRGLIAAPGSRAWLARARDGAAAGYALLTPPDLPGQQDGDAELRRIYVWMVWQGSGVGRALLETAAAAAREVGACRLLLGVHGRNGRALDFYRRAGFVPVATRLFQVGTIECDDLVLALHL